jgi:NAD(P)-dependent dehydrogenase (short-subunit alcohol dehydrogenase family)
MLKKAAERACIVCITSVHERVPKKGTTPYCVAKAGLNMLVKSLALEWARYGVRVVGLAPGAFATDINRQELADAREMYHEWIPTGRYGETREIGDAVVWLASDQAGYITGTTLTIDGGLTQAFHRLDMA